MGVLFAGQYYDRDDAARARDPASSPTRLYERADWNFFRTDGRAAISMGWHPGGGPDPGQLGRLQRGHVRQHPRARLADASRARRICGSSGPRHYPQFWRGEGPTRRIAFAPLFGHQYSHIFIDFRGIRDAVMREAGFDYFENSRRETYANRAYCIANPMGWDGYSDRHLGPDRLRRAGQFPAAVSRARRGTFYGYAARGPIGEPDGRDDGTIAPTAALGSLPFAPEIVIPCAEALLKQPRPSSTRYGFSDSFNPSFTYTDVKLETGSVDPQHGWVANDYLGIDQGPILLQAANYRDDFVWRYMRQVPAIRRGLKRAGFTGGWLG